LYDEETQIPLDPADLVPGKYYYVNVNDCCVTLGLTVKFLSWNKKDMVVTVDVGDLIYPSYAFYEVSYHAYGIALDLDEEVHVPTTMAGLNIPPHGEFTI
jgi:hypothetical protein